MSSGTFSKLYVQFVFATKGRTSSIAPEWEDELYKYITGIVTNKGQKLLAINGMPDHIHILINFKPLCCLSDLVREIKKASTVFINDNRWLKSKFSWQSGYGAFSYSEREIGTIIRYIQNQKIHHGSSGFKEEYTELLSEFDIKYENRFLFDFIDEK